MSARFRRLERTLRGETRPGADEARFVERFNGLAAAIIGEKVGHIQAENAMLRERIAAFNSFDDPEALKWVLEQPIESEVVRSALEQLLGKVEDLLRARGP